MTRVYVETWIFARAVVDCESGAVEELQLAAMHENVRVGSACLPVVDVRGDDHVPPAVAARARRIACDSDLSVVPWRLTR